MIARRVLMIDVSVPKSTYACSWVSVYTSISIIRRKFFFFFFFLIVFFLSFFLSLCLILFSQAMGPFDLNAKIIFVVFRHSYVVFAFVKNRFIEDDQIESSMIEEEKRTKNILKKNSVSKRMYRK